MSATSFTVIGNVCKILTVLINVSIWDKHASPLGLSFLCVCLVGAAAYQQSPLREDVRQARERMLEDESRGLKAPEEGGSQTPTAA